MNFRIGQAQTYSSYKSRGGIESHVWFPLSLSLSWNYNFFTCDSVQNAISHGLRQVSTGSSILFIFHLPRVDVCQQSLNAYEH